MITKDYTLKLLVYDVNGRLHETNCYLFAEQKRLEGMPENQIKKTIRKMAEWHKQQMINLGFPDKEAEAKLMEIIEKEMEQETILPETQEVEK